MNPDFKFISMDDYRDFKNQLKNELFIESPNL